MSAGNLSSDQFQLSMFEPAHKLMDGGVGRHNPGDIRTDDLGTPLEGSDEMWTRKAAEAEGHLQPILEREGVRRPVKLSVGLPEDHNPRLGAPEHEYQSIERGTILDGHHRIAAANTIDPRSEVPVEWTDRREWGTP